MRETSSFRVTASWMSSSFWKTARLRSWDCNSPSFQMMSRWSVEQVTRPFSLKLRNICNTTHTVYLQYSLLLINNTNMLVCTKCDRMFLKCAFFCCLGRFKAMVLSVVVSSVALRDLWQWQELQHSYTLYTELIIDVWVIRWCLYSCPPPFSSCLLQLKKATVS